MRNLTKKISTTRNQITFPTRCKSSGLTPRGLRVKLPLKSHNAHLLSQKISHSLLQESISLAHTRLAQLSKEKATIHQNLLRRLDQSQFRQMEDWILHHREQTHKTVKERHLKKFEKLTLEAQKCKDTRKIIYNYSSRSLDKAEEEVLSFGLNYSVAQRSIPYSDIIIQTEALTRNMDENKAQDLKSRVKWCLKHSRTPKPNLTRQQIKAVQRLRQDTTIKIIPADKGKATVVLDAAEYYRKMEELLKDSSYRRIKKDPTAKIVRELNQKLKVIEENGLMDR